MPEFRKVAVELLVRPVTPDRHSTYAEGIEDLAADIALNGLINPISVRFNSDGFYQIIAGDRRGLAVTMLKWSHVDCKIYGPGEGNDEDIKAAENLVRNQLSPTEEALAYKRRLPLEPDGTRSMALRLHVPQRRIENLLSLTDGDEQVFALLGKGEISVAQALEINKFETPAYRLLAIEQAYRHGLKAEGLRRWRMDVKHQGGEAQVQNILENLHSMAPVPIDEPMQICTIGNHAMPLRLSKHYVICSEHFDQFIRGLEALAREEEAKANGRGKRMGESTNDAPGF